LHRSAPCAPTNNRTKEGEKDSEKEEQWRYQVRQDADVRIGMAGDQIDREEETKGEKRAGSQNHSGPAKPVAEIAPKRPGLRGSWSVGHRANYLHAARKVTSKQPSDCRSCAIVFAVLTGRVPLNLECAQESARYSLSLLLE
jgi:hypothetical protein